MDTFEHDLNRYLKTQEDAANYDEYIDELTDKKWSELSKEVETKLASNTSWDDEYTTTRIINREPIETGAVFEDLIKEHIESERFARALAKLIASDAGSQVRVCLAQLHAASHAHNLALVAASNPD